MLIDTLQERQLQKFQNMINDIDAASIEVELRLTSF